MSAGEPNWALLNKLGKLPENQRDKVRFLGDNDKLQKQLDAIKKGMCAKCRDKFFPEKITTATGNPEA